MSSRVGAAVALVAAVGAVPLGGCTHTYVFSGAAPPRLEGTELVVAVPPRREPERLTVLDLRVEDEAGAARRASTDELARWGAGEATPELDRVVVDVSTRGRVWSDWVLPGFGVGAGLVFMTVAGLGLIRPDGSGELTVPLTLALAVSLGLEGALIGGTIGALSEEGVTDLRLDRAQP